MNPNAIGVETLVREGEIEVLESRWVCLATHIVILHKYDNSYLIWVNVFLFCLLFIYLFICLLLRLQHAFPGY